MDVVESVNSNTTTATTNTRGVSSRMTTTRTVVGRRTLGEHGDAFIPERREADRPSHHQNNNNNNNNNNNKNRHYEKEQQQQQQHHHHHHNTRKYQEGDVVYGQIYRMESYGAFLEWPDDKDNPNRNRGLLRQQEWSESLELHQFIYARIIRIHFIHHQMKIDLSIRGLNPQTGEELRPIQDLPKQPPPENNYYDSSRSNHHHPPNNNNHQHHHYRNSSQPVKNRAQLRNDLLVQWTTPPTDNNDESLPPPPPWMPSMTRPPSDNNQMSSLLRHLYSPSPLPPNPETNHSNNNKPLRKYKKDNQQQRQQHDTSSDDSSSSDSTSNDSSSSSSSSSSDSSKRPRRKSHKYKRNHDKQRKKRSRSFSSSSESSHSESSSTQSPPSKKQNSAWPRPDQPPDLPVRNIQDNLTTTLDAPNNDNNEEDDADDDDDSVGPQPIVPFAESDTALDSSQFSVHYGKALLPGEGQAMAQFVQQNLRVPRRGEIGLSLDDIDKYEKSGYVMSGSRHARMNAVRIRKENQVYSAEEQRALALMTWQENQQKEAALIHDWKQKLEEQKKQKEHS